jgi:DamX protein
MGLLRMHSELHERLEYLVNYSSQLVFVSGDSIAEQQQTLEAFVYQQHDDTEIAYLTAESNMEISDYRGQLCRQLLGQVVGSFVRPLNELLSALNKPSTCPTNCFKNYGIWCYKAALQVTSSI